VEDDKDSTPLKMYCEDDTISEIPVKKRKRGSDVETAEVGDDVVKRLDSVTADDSITFKNSNLPPTSPPSSPLSSSSADKKSNLRDPTHSNAVERGRGPGRGRGGRGASSCAKHKSINFGKSSSSVTLVANATPIVPKTAPKVTNNTIIDLTDISPDATPANSSQNTSSVNSNPVNPIQVTPSTTNPPTNPSSTIVSSASTPSAPALLPPPLPPPDHPRRKPFQCSFCPFSTERSLNLQNHQLTHADFLPQNKNAVGGVVGAPVSVPVGSISSGNVGSTCGNPNSSSVEDLTTQDGDDEDDEDDDEDDVQTDEPSGLLSCTECEYTTLHLSQLNRHMLLHSDVRPYTCDKCDFACNTSLNLDIHMQTHAGGDPSKSNELEQILDSNLGSAPAKQSFSITDFDLSFLTAPGAAAAAAVINGGSTAHSTSNGAIVATSPSSSSNGSSEDNPYRCGRCTYSSKNLNDLKQHFGSHVGEPLKAPLKCTKCNFSCNESTHLREHFQAAHVKKTSSEIS